MECKACLELRPDLKSVADPYHRIATMTTRTPSITSVTERVLSTASSSTGMNTARVTVSKVGLLAYPAAFPSSFPSPSFAGKKGMLGLHNEETPQYLQRKTVLRHSFFSISLSPHFKQQNVFCLMLHLVCSCTCVTDKLENQGSRRTTLPLFGLISKRCLDKKSIWSATLLQ